MLRAYLSHPIRGLQGKAATQEQMDVNLRTAIESANVIRQHFPALDLYVPAEHEEALNILYRKGYITIEQLLEADCEILGERDFMIVYAPAKLISSGMNVELQFAQSHAIPCHIMFNTTKAEIDSLVHFVTQYCLRG